MRLYNVEWDTYPVQTLKKYCIQLDHRIDALKRFIDNFNANYIVLNLPDDKKREYYNTQQLEQLKILLKTRQDDEDYSFIDPTKMITHQVIDNVYQKDLYIYNSDLPTDSGETYPEPSRIKEVIPQGFAVRHDGYNTDQTTKYSIIPLANSGSYYTLKDFVIKEINADSVITEITWSFTENATDIYGLNYLFSLVLPGSRFFPCGATDGLFSFTSSPIYLYNFTSTPVNPSIATLNKLSDNQYVTGGLWTTQYLLGHEILLDNNNSYEEVFGDTYTKKEQVRVGEYPQSRYIIYTSIPNGILSNLKINVY